MSESSESPIRGAGRDRQGIFREAATPEAAGQQRVVENLAPASTPDSDHRAVVWGRRVARAFPRRARIEAEAIPSEISASDFEGGLDLRHRGFMER